MFLKAVLIRFFKSFNYDFLRKHHPDAKPLPWEQMDAGWFPFVRVPLSRDITTVVGANESGKSHLLSAIEKGLTGADISRRDFCRYSQFFTVEKDELRWPDFGLHFSDVSASEQEVLSKAAGLKSLPRFDEFIVIRTDRTTVAFWLPSGGSYQKYAIADAASFMGASVLPSVFHIDSNVALPSSVPIAWLRGTTKKRWRRQQRADLIEGVDGLADSLQTQDTIKTSAGPLASLFAQFFSNDATVDTGTRATDSAQRLAKDLIFKVARIDKLAIADLAEALSKEDEGLANGILQQINLRLASALNFPKWWVQDRDFQLTVSARDDDLVFTIRDRTQTEYSFGERSNGLRYFLSYYIQYLAHDNEAGRPEILLMDEPDAFLSSQGQQDLLKIFNSFAHPDDARNPVQVVYVTHSPFLIDRNHGERIRVLEKGTDDEGTRVVNDASKNHYEPLRSSFGAFVGETTFIGNCNLMVEGLADQVLLAGCSTFLREKSAPQMNTLDLNRITIVPAGSASHIPYLVYLARGRDIEQPSVIVLLDADGSGKQAAKDLRRGGPKGKQLIKPDYVLTISDLTPEVSLPAGRPLTETEDLIPPSIAAMAAQRYLQAVCGSPPQQTEGVTSAEIVAAWSGDRALLDAVRHVVSERVGEDYHVDKVGFARCVVEVAQASLRGEHLPVSPDDVATFEKNLGALIARLALMQRKAERDTAQERISRRIDRSIKSFLRDHPVVSKREDAILLLEELEAVLDNSMESDEVKTSLQKLRRKHDLLEPKPGVVGDLSVFANDLRAVRYSAVNAVQETLGEAVAPPASTTAGGSDATSEPAESEQSNEPLTS